MRADCASRFTRRFIRQRLKQVDRLIETIHSRQRFGNEFARVAIVRAQGKRLLKMRQGSRVISAAPREATETLVCPKLGPVEFKPSPKGRLGLVKTL